MAAVTSSGVFVMVNTVFEIVERVSLKKGEYSKTKIITVSKWGGHRDPDQ
jgi:hypothetical protein